MKGKSNGKNKEGAGEEGVEMDQEEMLLELAN
jgi:hypothetical protein